MKRLTKLFTITGLLVMAFSSFASKALKTNANFSNDNREDIDLIIKTGETQLGGTLTLPAKFKTSSLVVMSSGSGDQDRDETLEGFKIFKVIADHLASEGIASFRYDDRGIGTSTGNFVESTLKDHSNDLGNILDYFKSNEEYSFNDFILFGHSQGGIVTAKVAVGNESVKKVILMAAPAVPLIEVVLYQVRQEYISTNLPKSLIEADVSAHNKLMWALRENKNIDEALQRFQEITRSILFELSPKETEIDSLKIEQEAIAKTKEFEIIYALPSLTSFLYYDPSEDYEQLQVPVLSLFGGLDHQVTIDQNKDRVENALLKSGTNSQFITFNRANHFFQKATSGSRDEYGKLEKKFVDNFLEEISDWIIGN